MHVHSSEAPLEVQADGTALQALGFHAIADESYDSAQYWPIVQVADPHVAAAGVGVGFGFVVLAGQSEAKLVALAMSSQLFPSRHVSWSAVGLALQTCAAQPVLAVSADPPHFVNFASQRLAQTSADAIVLPDEPDEPDEPAGVESVDEEHPTAQNAKDANEANATADREARNRLMRTSLEEYADSVTTIATLSDGSSCALPSRVFAGPSWRSSPSRRAPSSS
jgi:hypothetical protein